MKRSSAFSFSALVLLAMVGVQSAVAQDSSGVSKTVPETRKPMNDSETKPHIGLLGGMADTANSSRDTAVEYGVTVGFQPLIPWGAGLQLSRYSAGTDDAGGDDLNRTKLLARGSFNFGGQTPVLRYSYVELAAGPIFDEVDERWDIELGVAPGLGFDIPIAKDEVDNTRYTLGANANYLFVTGSNPETFALNGALKYWF
jgi:hypothetical protein